jgi:hypothetical protein
MILAAGRNRIGVIVMVSEMAMPQARASFAGVSPWPGLSSLQGEVCGLRGLRVESHSSSHGRSVAGGSKHFPGRLTSEFTTPAPPGKSPS